MINLQFLGECEFFEKKYLQADEFLFDEGEKDENLYIIYEGELYVEKRVKQGTEFKTLSIVRTGNIIGEGGLIRNHKKEVRIRASRNSTLLAIPGTKFVDFVRAYPSESYGLLIHIIAHTNDRLLKSNSEITANYEISRAIAHLENFDIESIEELLKTIQVILDSENIMYIEKNSVMQGYYKLKYHQGVNDFSPEDSVIYLGNEGFKIDTIKKEAPNILKKYAIGAELMYGGRLKGYIVVSRNTKKYNENELKLLENATISFAGVIGHKDILDIEKNKKHIKNV